MRAGTAGTAQTEGSAPGRPQLSPGPVVTGATWLPPEIELDQCNQKDNVLFPSFNKAYIDNSSGCQLIKGAGNCLHDMEQCAVIIGLDFSRSAEKVDWRLSRFGKKGRKQLHGGYRILWKIDYCLIKSDQI